MFARCLIHVVVYRPIVRPQLNADILQVNPIRVELHNDLGILIERD